MFNAQTRQLLRGLNEVDSAALFVIEHEFEVDNITEPFLLMQLILICGGIEKRIDWNYGGHGASWKRKVRKAFRELGTSFGLRLTN